VGTTLRAFQPTIKEVVQVGQELKGSLENELGLNELREAARPVPRASGGALLQDWVRFLSRFKR
jgi:hypothetical protein